MAQPCLHWPNMSRIFKIKAVLITAALSPLLILAFIFISIEARSFSYLISDYIGSKKYCGETNNIPQKKIQDVKMRSYGLSFVYKGDEALLKSNRLYIFFGCNDVELSNKANLSCGNSKIVNGEIISDSSYLPLKYYKICKGNYFVIGHINTGF